MGYNGEREIETETAAIAAKGTDTRFQSCARKGINIHCTILVKSTGKVTILCNAPLTSEVLLANTTENPLENATGIGIQRNMEKPLSERAASDDGVRPIFKLRIFKFGA